MSDQTGEGRARERPAPKIPTSSSHRGAGSGHEGTPGADQQPGTGDTMTDRFVAFHDANPMVYAELVDLCREFARATGRRKFGVRQPWERLRWNIAVRTTRPEGEPKLNDWYLPYYARLIDRQETDLAGLFEFRRAPEADAWAETLPRPRASGEGRR